MKNIVLDVNTHNVFYSVVSAGVPGIKVHDNFIRPRTVRVANGVRGNT